MINSTFEEIQQAMSQDKQKEMILHLCKWVSKRKGSIRNMVEKLMDDVSMLLSQAEVASGIDMYREATATKVVGTMNDVLHSKPVALHILWEKYTKKDDLNKVLSLKSSFSTLLLMLQQITGWLVYTYQALMCNEQVHDIWDYMNKR